jgi:hypothetical protein
MRDLGTTERRPWALPEPEFLVVPFTPFTDIFSSQAYFFSPPPFIPGMAQLFSINAYLPLY